MSGKNNRCRKEWTVQEFEKFASCIADNDAKRLAYLIMYWTGLRVGETLGLQMKNLKLDQGMIYVRQSYCSHSGKYSMLKTDNAKRDVEIPPFLARELSSYLKENYATNPDRRVFDLSANELQKSLDDYCQNAGIAKIPVHYFRNMHRRMLDSLDVPDELIRERLGTGIAIETVKDSEKIKAYLKETLENLYEEAVS